MTILTAKNFRRCLTTPGRYRDTLGEVKGLLLVVVNEQNASWQLRYERNGRERWMGLGPARLIGVREARIRARAVRLQILDGIDPLDSRRAAKAAAATAALKTLTFSQAATAYNEHHEGKWKNPRHAAQFLTSLRDYVFPVFGSLPCNAIDTALVLKVLEQTVAATKNKRLAGFGTRDQRPPAVSDGGSRTYWIGRRYAAIGLETIRRSGPGILRKCCRPPAPAPQRRIGPRYLMRRLPHSWPRCAAVMTLPLGH